MKASEFKRLIKEAVKEAIQEELRQPQIQEAIQPVQTATYTSTGNPMLDAINETRTNMTPEDYRNIAGGTMQSSMAQNFNRAAFMPQGRAIKPVSDDPQAVAAAVAAAPKQGLDLSQLGFVNKAAAIVNTAEKKQREKYGL
jgi:hypothetical protein